MFIEHCLQHFSIILPWGETVTVSKIPKYSNKIPVARKLDPFCDGEATFYAKWSIFWQQEFRY